MGGIRWAEAWIGLPQIRLATPQGKTQAALVVSYYSFTMSRGGCVLLIAVSGLQASWAMSIRQSAGRATRRSLIATRRPRWRGHFNGPQAQRRSDGSCFALRLPIAMLFMTSKTFPRSHVSVRDQTSTTTIDKIKTFAGVLLGLLHTRHTRCLGRCRERKRTDNSSGHFWSAHSHRGLCGT